MSQPLYLFADSQPLFWRGGAFLAGLCQAAGNSQPNVAYIGASSGDSPDAHGIFSAAFEQIGTRRTHWVRAAYPTAPLSLPMAMVPSSRSAGPWRSLC